jgi:hypothetical protein
LGHLCTRPRCQTGYRLRKEGRVALYIYIIYIIHKYIYKLKTGL